MKIRKFPYRLGLIIPCTIIALNGASAYYAVFRFDDDKARNMFLFTYTCLCVSYFLAVKMSPGYTDGHVEKGGLYVTCTKCNLPKPERAHHCKTCGRCVLRMDHHCRWTENCVGFNNIGHFVRFLSITSLLTGYGLYRSADFLIFAMKHRSHLRLVISDKKRIWLAGFSVISNFLVCFTISLLWIRVIVDTLNGQTQIEHWEQERAYTLYRRKLAPKYVFPFDIDYFTNILETFGPIYGWALPWGGPSGSGHVFKKLVDDEGRWPPAESKEVHEHEYYRKDRWVSVDGEQFQDLGIDSGSDADDDDDKPLSEVVDSKKTQ